MNSSQTEEYFDRVAVPFNRNYLRNDAFVERKRIWKRVILENLSRLAGGAACLDMGCGDGVLGRIVALQGFKITGIDQSKEMLALAVRRSKEQGVGAHTEYLHASLPLQREFMDLRRGTAGLVLCSSVLEYIDAYEQVLEQFAQLLRKNGRLIISVPNGHSLYRKGTRLLGRILAHRNSYLRYQRHDFYPHDFKARLASLGYSIVHEEYFSLPFQALSSKVLGRRRGKRTATLYLLVAEKL
jgi:2-polyprenyl-3-methyl-5-hydroxy-6-metoxy-1,4-benzoquinol methylase